MLLQATIWHATHSYLKSCHWCRYTSKRFGVVSHVSFLHFILLGPSCFGHEIGPNLWHQLIIQKLENYCILVHASAILYHFDLCESDRWRCETYHVYHIIEGCEYKQNCYLLNKGYHSILPTVRVCAQPVIWRIDSISINNLHWPHTKHYDVDIKWWQHSRVML
jgi:hypothetical protein